MESIKTKIDRFYSLIKDYEEGAPDTRFKSWEWCHLYFLEHRKCEDDETKDIMALHLAFYLASWGMYRGSSYLLQRDYKAHKKAVEIITDKKYESLWDFNPSDDENILQAADLIFGSDGVYWRIKESYRNYEGNADDASDTLVTKILMGTFGCIPSFDRYLKRGMSICFCYAEGKNVVNGYKVTKSIENRETKNGLSTFIALSYFVKNHASDFRIDNHPEYPQMKCLDMFLWETGYELDLYDVLSGKINGNKESAKRKAVKLNLANQDSTCEEIIERLELINKA